MVFIVSSLVSLSTRVRRKMNFKQYFALHLMYEYWSKEGVSLKHTIETETNNKVMKFPLTFYIANESSLCCLANFSSTLNDRVNHLPGKD